MNRLQKEFWAKDHNFREYTHPVVRHFSTQRVNFLKKFIRPNEVRNILDAGAGEGFSSFYLQDICRNIVATDFSEKMLAKNPVNKRAIADICSLPFKNGSFDMVCAWEVFHHLDNHAAAAQEFIRVSRRYICIFEVNRNNPVQFLFALANKEHRGAIKFSKKYLLKLFDKNVRLIMQATTGVIFPNKTPLFMFALLSKFPFVLPFLGISNVIILERI